MSEEPVLRPDEVQEILSDPAAPADDGPQPYSLREPLAIPPAALAAARETMERVVASLNETIGHEDAIEVSLDDLQQQTVAAALTAMPPPWTAALGREGNGGLALALHPSVGLTLVDLALGGPGTPPDDTREPTQLESAVLRRLLAAAANRVSEVLDERLVPVACGAGEIPATVVSAGETVAVGLLRFKIGEGHHTSLLLITASLLITDSQSATAPLGEGPGPLEAILEQVPLEIRPVLAAGSVSFHDVMALEVGDVLRLDVAEETGLELRAEGHAVAIGRVVRTDDRAVFKISRSCRPSASEEKE